MQPTQTGPTPQRLMQFAFGFAPPLIISSAVHHRVFDVLDAGPLTLQQLVQKTGASDRGVRAIAEALVSFDLLKRDGERYALTPESQTFLVRGKPGFHGGMVQHMVQMMPKWMQMDDVVATGKPACAVNEQGDGSQFFTSFVEDLFAMNYPAASALGRTLNIAARAASYRVLDLAAGSGVWGIAIAQQSPQVRVTALDWPAVLETTKRVVARHQLSERFEYTAGDLDQADFGSGYQLATLGHILHSEGASASQSLLAKVFKALAPGGTIAIAEFLRTDPPYRSPMPYIFAVNMLVNTQQGDTFSAAEIGRWLTAAGFEQVRTVDSPGPSPLILAAKPR